VALLDLDNFLQANEQHGAAFGDRLLVVLGQRLQALYSKPGSVARIGGDEFLICLEGPIDSSDVEEFCTELLGHFTEETVIENRRFLITLSIGVSCFPEDGQDLTTLLKNADVALYDAKEGGRNLHRRYSALLRSRIEKRVSLENDLRRAVEEEQFEVFYQPRLDAASNVIVGAEALLRWRHPTRGLLMPAAFISTCEQNGMITEIGEWVLEQVGKKQYALARDGYPITLSANLSPRQFKSPSLVDSVLALPERTGCDPTKIDLEITESMLMSSDDDITDLLSSFKDRGFGIAIDDFGTGYSNLAYIQRYPITSLKIDRSFVSDIGSNGAVTQLILSLAKLLGVRAVAEGVETMEQLEWLRANNCKEYQGFLYAPAVSADEFQQMLACSKSGTADVLPFSKKDTPGRAASR